MIKSINLMTIIFLLSNVTFEIQGSLFKKLRWLAGSSAAIGASFVAHHEKSWREKHSKADVENLRLQVLKPELEFIDERWSANSRFKQLIKERAYHYNYALISRLYYGPIELAIAHKK